MSDNPNIDPLCNSPLLDPSLFPVGTATFVDPNYNVLPYLCQLLQVANDETINPVLATPPEFDITPFTDFSGLGTVGDPRVSLGVTISATLINFLPRMITQTEVLQSGGSQVIDNYICDSDGQPIKESKVLPALFSLSANQAFRYGALEIPPINVSLEELLRPIEPNEIRGFVSNFIKNSRSNSSEYFVNFLNTWFLFDERWEPSIHMYGTGGFFFLKLEFYQNVTDIDYEKSLYLKYYEDQAHELGCKLGLSEIIYHTENVFGNNALSKGMAAPIFDYKKIVNGPMQEQQNFYNMLMSTFLTSKVEESSLQNLFNPNFSLQDAETTYKALTSIYGSPSFNITESLSSIPIDLNQCAI
jgi:hypothetical protein